MKDKLIIKAQQPILKHAKECAKCKGRTTFSIITKCDVAYNTFIETQHQINELLEKE